jgi:MFS family permease
MFRNYFSAFSASLFSFYNLMLFSLMNVLAPYWIQDNHFSVFTVGFISSWDLWGNVIGFLPIGYLLDRYNTRLIAFVLLSLAIVSTMGLAVFHQIGILCGLRFLQGLSSAGSLLIIMRLGTSLFHDKTNKTIGFMILIALSGGIVGNSLFASLAMQFTWQIGLMLIALIGIIFLIILFFGLQDAEKSPSVVMPSIKILSLCFREGLQLGILNSPVFILGSLLGSQFLMQKAQLNLTQAAAASSLIFAGIMVGSPILGMLADKIGSFWILVSGYTGLILGAGILLFSYELAWSHYNVLFFFLGVACCSQNLIYPLIANRYPQSRSTAMATAAIISNGIGAGLQLLFSFLMQ